MNLLDLPACVLQHIFEYLTYDEIAKARLICVQIDRCCQNLLNRGFSKIVRRHSVILKRIKSLLPRRESERRKHLLARHCDILTCVETRISMLSMTYTKYIDLNLCCFIPGKVIDEISSILNLVESPTKPLRAPDVLQELRDISSMAIDHFDEKIAHSVKKAFCDLNKQKFGFYQIMQSVSMDSANNPQSIDNSSDDITTVNKNVTTKDYQEVNNNRLAIIRLDRKLKNMSKKLTTVTLTQNKQLKVCRTHSVQLSELKSHVTNLRRRLEESETKNRELSANINQLLSGGGGATSTDSKSPGKQQSAVNKTEDDTGKNTETTCCNIKPRTATIVLKRNRNSETIVRTSSDSKLRKLNN